jgi:hypothetical protein
MMSMPGSWELGPAPHAGGITDDSPAWYATRWSESCSDHPIGAAAATSAHALVFEDEKLARPPSARPVWRRG